MCHYKKSGNGATVIGFTDLPSGDESALKEASATIGPISIAIDASHESFQMYSGGEIFVSVILELVLLQEKFICKSPENCI